MIKNENVKCAPLHCQNGEAGQALRERRRRGARESGAFGLARVSPSGEAEGEELDKSKPRASRSLPSGEESKFYSLNCSRCKCLGPLAPSTCHLTIVLARVARSVLVCYFSRSCLIPSSVEVMPLSKEHCVCQICTCGWVTCPLHLALLHLLFHFSLASASCSPFYFTPLLFYLFHPALTLVPLLCSNCPKSPL